MYPSPSLSLAKAPAPEPAAPITMTAKKPHTELVWLCLFCFVLERIAPVDLVGIERITIIDWLKS